MAEQAFLLLIQQEYKSIRDRDVFIEMFKPLAKYVKQHEPETLAYELSVSDKDPHKLLIFERYAERFPTQVTPWVCQFVQCHCIPATM